MTGPLTGIAALAGIAGLLLGGIAAAEEGPKEDGDRAPASGVVALHEGDASPADEGWTLHAAPGSKGLTSETAIARDEMGGLAAWEIAKTRTTGSSFYCYHADDVYGPEAAAEAERKGWRLTVKCRVLESSGEHGQNFELATTRRRYPISWGRYLKFALPAMIVVVGICWLYLILRYA